MSSPTTEALRRARLAPTQRARQLPSPFRSGGAFGLTAVQVDESFDAESVGVRKMRPRSIDYERDRISSAPPRVDYSALGTRPETSFWRSGAQSAMLPAARTANTGSTGGARALPTRPRTSSSQQSNACGVATTRFLAERDRSRSAIAGARGRSLARSSRVPGARPRTSPSRVGGGAGRLPQPEAHDLAGTSRSPGSAGTTGYAVYGGPSRGGAYNSSTGATGAAAARRAAGPLQGAWEAGSGCGGNDLEVEMGQAHDGLDSTPPQSRGAPRNSRRSTASESKFALLRRARRTQQSRKYQETLAPEVLREELRDAQATQSALASRLAVEALRARKLASRDARKSALMFLRTQRLPKHESALGEGTVSAEEAAQTRADAAERAMKLRAELRKAHDAAARATAGMEDATAAAAAGSSARREAAAKAAAAAKAEVEAASARNEAAALRRELEAERRSTAMLKRTQATLLQQAHGDNEAAREEQAAKLLEMEHELEQQKLAAEEQHALDARMLEQRAAEAAAEAKAEAAAAKKQAAEHEAEAVRHAAAAAAEQGKAAAATMLAEGRDEAAAVAADAAAERLAAETAAARKVAADAALVAATAEQSDKGARSALAEVRMELQLLKVKESELHAEVDKRRKDNVMLRARAAWVGFAKENRMKVRYVATQQAA